MKKDHSLVAIDPKPGEKPTPSSIRYPIPEQPKIPLGIAVFIFLAIVAAIAGLYCVYGH